MLQNLLSAGNDTLKQLKTLKAKGLFLTQEEAEDYQRELQIVQTKVRESWTFAVCTDGSGEVLSRYFNYQFNYISGLLLNENETNESSCQIQRDLSIFDRSICDLIDCACDLFLHFITLFPSLSAVYKRHFIRKLKVDAEQLITILDKAWLDAGIKSPLIAYLKDMTENFDGICEIPQLHYFRSFVRELNPLLNLHSEDSVMEFINAKVYDLDFNQFGVFVYLQAKIRTSYSGKPKRERKLIMEQNLTFLQFKSKGCVMRYDQRWPSLSVMLFEWLKNERVQMEQVCLKSSVLATRLFKLPFQLPVSHIAFLVRLLYKANVFGSVQLTEIFTFFTTHISSKRQQHLSPGAFSKDYYTKDMVTAVEVRHLLSKMISEINRDYFPVLAAICAVIFC
nr:hypothetical protein [Mucilaginibacter sp. L294]